MLLSLVRGDPAFSMFRPIHEWSWHARGGVPVTEPWEAIEFTRVEGDAAEFIAADCLTMNTGADGFLISEFARNVLSPRLDRAGEFWPVSVLGQPYWWLNCMASVEALDRVHTDADWSIVDGAWGLFSWISTTRRLAFRPTQVENAPMLFRIPEYPQGVLFAREELRAIVEEAGLVGFRFDAVWSKEEGGIADPPGVGFGGVFDQNSAKEVEFKRSKAREILARRSQTV